MASTYVVDTSSDLGGQHMTLLESVLDAPTTAFLDELDIRPGQRCLDLGAGGGSITRWLAERTGPRGTVVAVDTDTDHLLEQPGVQVLRHDLTEGLPVDGPFDASVGGRLDRFNQSERPARRAPSRSASAASPRRGAGRCAGWS